MFVLVAGTGKAPGLYVSSLGVTGSARLCFTFSHSSLQPLFSVCTMPPERVCGRPLSECVSLCRCVCLACCVPPLLVSGDLRLYFYNSACFWRFGGLGCLAEMWNLLCLSYFVRECFNGTAGCHDYTEQPSNLSVHRWTPIMSSSLFLNYNPSSEHTVTCASSAFTVSRTQKRNFSWCRNKMFSCCL